MSDIFGVERHGSSDLKCVFIDPASRGEKNPERVELQTRQVYL